MEMSGYSTRSRAKLPTEDIDREAHLGEMIRRQRMTTPASAESATFGVADSGVVTSNIGVQSPSTSNRLPNPEANVTEIPLEGGKIHDHSRGGITEEESVSTQNTTRRLARESTATLCAAPGAAASVVSSKSSRAQREAARRRIEYETELELFQTQQRLARMKKAMQIAELEAEEELEDQQLGKPRSTVDRQSLVGEWVDKSPFAAADNTPRRPENEYRRDQLTGKAPMTDGRRDTSKERRLPGKAIEDLAAALQSIAKPRPMPRAFYELPHFNGDPADWLFFKRRYEESSMMYEFRPSENISRLQMSIHGKAKELVEDLLRTSIDPREIMQALDRTYGNPTTLLQCAMKKIRNLPRIVDNDSEAIRSFSAAVRSSVSTLRNIKADGYLNNPQLVRELLDKLTPAQRTEYSKFARRVSSETNVDLRVSPTLSVLVDFLEELADTAAFMVSADINASGTYNRQTPFKPTPGRQQPAMAAGSRPAKFVHKVMEVSEVDNNNDCDLCKGKHELPNCEVFKKMDDTKKWDFVKKNRLCFKCLVRKHYRMSCRAKKCMKCGYNHHTLLHVTKDNSDDSVNPTAERVTNLGDRRMKSLLKVVPVIVTVGDVEHSTYALLDDGATVSLIDSSLTADMLGPKSPLHIVSAGGHSVIDKDSKQVKVMLRGPNNKCYTVPMRTIKNIELPPQTVPKGVLDTCKHLRGLNCGEVQDAKPLLLLGQDNWELIVGGDIRRGKSGQPVASLTQLGWVLHGPLSIVERDTEEVHYVSVLNDLEKKQLELDAIGTSEDQRTSHEDIRATKMPQGTAKLTNIGLKINLRKADDIGLPDTRGDTEKKQSGIDKKMNENLQCAVSYCTEPHREVKRGWTMKNVELCINLPRVVPERVSVVKLGQDSEMTPSLAWSPCEDTLTSVLAKEDPADEATKDAERRDQLPSVCDSVAKLGVRSPCEDTLTSALAKKNSVDEATRAGWKSEQSIWFSGPPFLRKPTEEWPAEEDSEPTTEAVSELRANPVHATVRVEPVIDITRFSSWTRAVRALARALAWIERLKTKIDVNVNGQHIRKAEELLIKQSQEAAFGVELKTMKQGEALPPQSPLKSLDPMISEDGLLRVRGRLVAADRPFEERHPIILNGRELITELLVQHYHRKALHANNEAVVNILREKYWIVKLRPTVKRVARKCQFCRVKNSLPAPPKMGDLPAGRMAHHRRAFSHCGIDYFGPMEVTIGRRREKRWGVVLTCLTTRAIHLEIAASLSADSAIMALRRFFARRGQPEVIYSDRGTNFVGANTELRSALQQMNFHQLEDEAATRGIRWSFISPASPHMGGCWERLVRSTKTALKATLKEKAPKEEVLQTLFAEVEAIINSRPLTHVAVDPNDPVALTPNHLLLGTASNTTRLGDFNERDLCTRKQWRIVQALADSFWSRWTREYLPTLQPRQKWTSEVPPLKPGDVVVIVDGTLPRNVWPKGIIVSVYPGQDGQVRVVDVKTSHGILRRPATKIAVLPTSADVSDSSPQRGGGMLTVEQPGQ